MTTSTTTWDRRATLALAVLVAACAVSLIWLVHPWYEATGETNDGSVYLLCAKAMLAGKGYSYLGQAFSLRPPGFSVLLLPVLALRGLDFHVLNLWIATFGILTVACLFAFQQPRLGTLLAFAVAASFWLNPAFERFCNRVMSDVPGTALLFVGLLLERWSRRKPSKLRDALVGVFVGLSAYVRTVDVVLAPAIVCARLAERWRRGERGGWLRFALDRCLVPLVVPALVLLPWSIRNAMNPPQLPIDQTFVHSYSVALFHVNTADPSSPLVPVSELLQRTVDNGASIVTSTGNRMLDDKPSPGSWILGGAIAALALVAVVRRREVDDFVLLGSLAAFSISLEVKERYVLTLYALAVPSALDTVRWALARWTGERAVRIGLAALVVLVAIIDFEPHRGWDKVLKRHQEYIDTSAALRAALPQDAVVATGVGWHFALYLDRPVYSILPKVAHERRKTASEEVIDRYGINTVFSADFRSYDDSVVALMRERYGASQHVGEAQVWRVRH